MGKLALRGPRPERCNSIHYLSILGYAFGFHAGDWACVRAHAETTAYFTSIAFALGRRNFIALTPDPPDLLLLLPRASYLTPQWACLCLFSQHGDVMRG